MTTTTLDPDTLYYFDSATGRFSTRPPARALPPEPPRHVEGCPTCEQGAMVPHHNCLYGGTAMGHSSTHCTAAACF